MTARTTDVAGERATIITLPGEIDMANVADVGADLAAGLAGRPAAMIIDMSGTWYSDLAGVRAVLRTCELADQAGCGVRLVVSSAAVLRLLALLGADQRTAIYPALPAALSAVPPAAGSAVPPAAVAAAMPGAGSPALAAAGPAVLPAAGSRR